MTTPVGVTLIAEGQTEFEAALNKATEAINLLNASVGKLGEVVIAETLAEKNKIDVLTGEVGGFQKLNETLKITNDLLALQTSIMLDNSRAASENAGAVGKTTEANVSFIAAARAARIALAAVTAEMALMNVAAGVTLPQGLRELGDSLKIIGDLTIAGFYVGGGPGALIGGLVGAIVALGTAANSVDPAISELNKQLDTLAKHADVAETLAKITDTTTGQAQAYLDASKNSDAAAASLQKYVTQIEHTRNVLDAFAATEENTNGLTSRLGEGINVFADEVAHTGQTLNELTLLTIGVASAGEVWLRTLIATGDVIQAQKAGIEALRNVILGNNQSLIDAAKAQLDQATAAEQAGVKIKALQREYDNYINKLTSEKDVLAQLTGITEDQSQSITKYAQAHTEAGTEIAATIRQVETLKDAILLSPAADQAGLNKALDDAIARLDMLTQKTLAAAAAQAKLDEFMKEGIKAQDDYAKSLENTTKQLDQLNARTQNELNAAQQQFTDASANADRSRREADASAEQSHTDRLSDIYLQRSERLLAIQQTFNDAVLKADQTRNDRESDIAQQLADRESDIALQLSDRIDNIQHDLAVRLAELAHTREQATQSANAKEAKAAQDLAEKLYQIEKKRIEDTEALDFNTAEQLRNAKTDHDREAILRRHQFEQGQIDQNANDAKQTAEQTYTDAVKLAEKEKQLAEQTFEYEKRLAEQKAAYDIAQAERTAAEQRAVAERTSREQIAAAERTAREAIAAAQKTATEQQTLAQQTYTDEKNVADRARTETLAKDKKAEADKLADAQTALKERTKAIENTYTVELLAIQATRDAAIAAFNDIIDAINLANQGLLGFAQSYQNFLNDPLGGSNPNFLPHITPKGGGGQIVVPYGSANGADFTVPSGYPNDTFPLNVSSGEHVQVTPAGMSNSNNSQNITFYISGVTDPKAVAAVVKQMFSSATAST